MKFGVRTDEGGGDGWPGIRSKILAADIVVLATPTMGRVNCRHLETRPEATRGTTTTAVAGAAHLARLLRETPYPKS